MVPAIQVLESLLAKIAAREMGDMITYAYCEVGRYKPYGIATIQAAKRRGYRVEKVGKSAYRVYPKASQLSQL